MNSDKINKLLPDNWRKTQNSLDYETKWVRASKTFIFDKDENEVIYLIKDHEKAREKIENETQLEEFIFENLF